MDRSTIFGHIFMRLLACQTSARRTLVALSLLVRACLFARPESLLISQLTFTEGRSTIRHLWTRQNSTSSTPTNAGTVSRSAPGRLSPGIKSRLALFENQNGVAESAPALPARKSSSPRREPPPLPPRPLVSGSRWGGRSSSSQSPETTTRKASEGATGPVQKPESPSEDCWTAVRLRVKRQEEQHRKAVAGARRSLHLNVHVGGGESLLCMKLNNYAPFFIRVTGDIPYCRHRYLLQ
ncbi:unnamed protein product [Schistocephalus solidus]|uniref:Secreted protein n=1 Tax=Schistocephalus solidus TaxID=70667 RepID=A0A183T433_SCHSO|nr:unnamed protein product [Schistocephalus solidus]